MKAGQLSYDGVVVERVVGRGRGLEVDGRDEVHLFGSVFLPAGVSSCFLVDRRPGATTFFQA